MDATLRILFMALQFLGVSKNILDPLEEKAKAFGYHIVDVIVAAGIAWLSGLLSQQPDWVVQGHGFMSQAASTAAGPLGGIGIYFLMQLLARLLAGKEK